MENEIKFYRMRSGEFVEKIKIDKKQRLEKRVIKFHKERIEIKPYINIKDALDIVSLVLGNYYNEEKGDVNLLASTKIDYSYFLAVCKYMTNVETDEEESLNDLIDSGFIEVVKENVLNYNDILKSIYFAIEQKNNYDREKDLEFYIDEAFEEIRVLLKDSEKNVNIETKELEKSLKELKDLQENGLPKEKKNKTDIKPVVEVKEKKTKKVTKK